MHDKPNEPFGMIAIETTETTERPLHLNRRTKVWEEDGAVIDYFTGEAGGQRAVPLVRGAAAVLAKSFGATLP